MPIDPETSGLGADIYPASCLERNIDLPIPFLHGREIGASVPAPIEAWDGHLFCTQDCPIIRNLSKGELVSDYDLVIKGPEADSTVVNVGAFVAPESYGKEKDMAAFLVFRKVSIYRIIKRLAAELRFPETTSKPTKYNLSMREMEILKLAAQGMKTPQIARRLSISEVTVRSHFKNIFFKLRVHSRAEAISLALRYGFF